LQKDRNALVHEAVQFTSFIDIKSLSLQEWSQSCCQCHKWNWIGSGCSIPVRQILSKAHLCTWFSWIPTWLDKFNSTRIYCRKESPNERECAPGKIYRRC
jgi:hypothetical protein